MIRTDVPPNTAVLGTGEKPAVFRNGGIGREYKLKNPYLGLEMGGGIGRDGIGGTLCIVSEKPINYCSQCSLALLSPDYIGVSFCANQRFNHKITLILTAL